jgi:hypothetical protein
MRGIAIPKGINYIFQKKTIPYFLLNLFFFLKKKRKTERKKTHVGAGLGAGALPAGGGLLQLGEVLLRSSG